jgi:hypothetical protein
MFGVAKSGSSVKALYWVKIIFKLTLEQVLLSRLRVLHHTDIDGLLSLLLLEHAEETRFFSLSFLRTHARKTVITSNLAVIQVLESSHLWVCAIVNFMPVSYERKKIGYDA